MIIQCPKCRSLDYTVDPSTGEYYCAECGYTYNQDELEEEEALK